MIDGEMTDAFHVAHGVKQGCILAPTMFTLFLAAVLEVSNYDTNKGVYITTRSEAKTKVRQLYFRDTLTIQALCDILRLICKRYLTGLPLLLRLLDSLSMFEKLRSCINPLPGHHTQHRRSCSMVRHFTSLPPLHTLGAPSQTPVASTNNCRHEFSRPLPRSDEYLNDYGTNTTSSL